MHRIITFYTDNVPDEVVKAQKAVFDKFDIPLEQIKPELWHGHAGSIDRWLAENNDWDVLTIFDIDCIPLDKDIVNEFRDQALEHLSIQSVAQKASHIIGSIVYASPACITFSRDTYETLGRPEFACTERSDCGGELTYSAMKNNAIVALLHPTRVEVPKWELDEGRKFGLGTTYGDRIYHAFLSRKGNSKMFINKCNEILNK